MLNESALSFTAHLVLKICFCKTPINRPACFALVMVAAYPPLGHSQQPAARKLIRKPCDTEVQLDWQEVAEGRGAGSQASGRCHEMSSMVSTGRKRCPPGGPRRTAPQG